MLALGWTSILTSSMKMSAPPIWLQVSKICDSLFSLSPYHCSIPNHPHTADPLVSPCQPYGANHPYHIIHSGRASTLVMMRSTGT